MAAHQGLMTAGAVMAFIADMYSAVFHAQAPVRAVGLTDAAHNTAGRLPENLLQHLDKRLAFLCVLVSRSYFKPAVCVLRNGKCVNS